MLNNKRKKTIVCFTASFPFGLKETFFENELPFLAKAFERVIIVPTYNPSGKRETRSVPENVVFSEPTVVNNKALRIIQGVFNLSPIRYHVIDFFKSKVYKKKSSFERWLNSLLVYRKLYAKFNLLSKRENLSKDTLLYSYWAEAPLFVTKMCARYKRVVRMHRSDFYTEFSGDYLPLRQQIYNACDLLAPISQDIVRTLKAKYKIEEGKIHLSYLGVSNSSLSHSNSFNRDQEITDPIRIVSCSRVDPEKRVNLIKDALLSYNGNRAIEWHHFGDGKLFKQLKASISDLPKQINVALHGWTLQEQLFSFYKAQYVTWFVNVSLSEGIPVSIMEAMSFGIPVIATDVGGTREIVSKKNGYLILENFDPKDLLQLFVNNTGETYLEKRKNAYTVWMTNFNAEKNYKEFVQRLLDLVDQ
jgi:Glycosyltransferase